MRLKPKNITDTFSLDEYNACQFLLNNMTCWNEEILLNTYTPYNGKFYKYLFKNFGKIFQKEKFDTYRLNITQNTTIKNNTTNNIQFGIQLSQPDTPTFGSSTNWKKYLKYITFKIKIYYQTNTTTTYTYTDNEKTTTINETGSTDEDINGTKTYNSSTKTTTVTTSIDATDDNDYREDGNYEETIKEPDLEDWESIILTGKIINNIFITFSLLDTNNNLLIPEDSIIHKTAIIYIQPIAKPYIDINNGKANSDEEILLDHISEVEKLIKYVPTDGTLTVIRLDSDTINYIPENTITIKNGQNIEIRGGTNRRAYFEGTTAHRCFIIKPGGQLKLQNIGIIQCNSKLSEYETGKGGAILVESNTDKYGILTLENCMFSNNTANYGGAIYSSHAGIYINKCYFTGNTSSSGGAVMYKSNDIVMTTKDIIGIAGNSVTGTITVHDYAGNNVANNTLVRLYVNDESYENIYTVNGVATFDYNIPKTYKDKTITVIAKCGGTEDIDEEIVKCIIYVKQPDTYTATMTCVDNIEKGETLSIKVQVVNQNKVISTNIQGYFIINNQNYNATIVDKYYTLKYVIPSDTTLEKLEIEFVLNSEFECNTPIKTVILKNKPAEVTSDYIHALFINSTIDSNNNCTITETDINNMITAGYTDLYVRMIEYDNPKYLATLQKVCTLSKNKKIRVHATFNTFYRQSIKQWTLVNGDYDYRISWLKKEVDKVSANLDVDGFCLDYFRYPGTDGTSTTKHTKVTSSAKILYDYIKTKNKNYNVSIVVMPEKASNSIYYGQDYKELSVYCDYEVAMVYEGNYNAGDTWAVGVAKYIIEQTSKEKTVIALQTYNGDNDVTKLEKAVLDTTIKLMADLDVKGVAMFRYGLVNNPTSYVKLKEV